MRYSDSRTEDPRLVARDAIIRLATTPAHKGDLDAAAEELAQRPHWQQRRNTLHSGLTLARALVGVWGSAKQAERAINGDTERAMERLLDRETVLALAGTSPGWWWRTSPGSRRKAHPTARRVGLLSLLLLARRESGRRSFESTPGHLSIPHNGGGLWTM